ncbi:MAG: hypothetical protein ABSC57_04190, partial [Syntrophales bacterium]
MFRRFVFALLRSHSKSIMTRTFILALLRYRIFSKKRQSTTSGVNKEYHSMHAHQNYVMLDFRKHSF